MLEDLCEELIQKRDSIQRYPFSSGTLNQKNDIRSDLEVIRDEVPEDLGLSSFSINEDSKVICSFSDFNDIDKKDDLDDKCGILFIFTVLSGGVYITLTNRNNSNQKFFVDFHESKKPKYISFSSDFEYEIDCEDSDGDITKYIFNFDSKESYSPNPEVLNVVKYVEYLAENIDSPISSVIFDPYLKIGVSDNQLTPESVLYLNTYKETSKILKKVVYGVYLFNSRYELPLVGASLLCITKELKGYVPRSRFVTGPLSNSKIQWMWRSNPPLTLDEKTKKIKNASSQNDVYWGIDIIQPEVPANDLLELIRSLNGETDSPAYRHCYCLIIRGLKSQNVEFSWGTPADYFIGLIELSKSRTNQIEYIINELETIGIKELPITLFSVDELEIMSNILGWSGTLKLFDSLSSTRFSWSCAIYTSFHDLLSSTEKFDIAEKDVKSIEEYNSSMLENIVNLLDDTFTQSFIINDFRVNLIVSSEQYMLEILIKRLLQSNDEDILSKTSKLIDSLSKLHRNYLDRDTIILIAEKCKVSQLVNVFKRLDETIERKEFEYYDKGPTESYYKTIMLFINRKKKNETIRCTIDELVNVLHDYPEELANSIKKISRTSVTNTHYVELSKYLSQKQLEEVLEVHHVPNNINLFNNSEAISKTYLLFMAKKLFNSPQDYSSSYSVIFDYFGNNKEDISFIFSGNRLQKLIVYEKLRDYFEEDFVLSLMQDESRIINTSFNLMYPDFIQYTALSTKRNLASLEKEYVKCYIAGRLNDPSIQPMHIPYLMHQSLFPEELDYFVEIMTKCKDIYIRLLEKTDYLTIAVKLDSIFETLQKLEPLYPDFGLLQGLRMFLEGVKDKCDELLLNPKEDCYQYHTIKKNGVCNCGNVCFSINNALSAPQSTINLHINSEDLDHIQEQFNNNIPKYRLMIEKPLNELIELTTSPGSKGRLVLHIKKKLVIPYNIQTLPYVQQAAQELLFKLPSNAKSARKRHLPPSNEEPPHKIQKQQ